MKTNLAYYKIVFALLAIIFMDFLPGCTGSTKADLPFISHVKPFTFINQYNKPFTRAGMDGKVCVVNYFFTTCRGICPRMNSNMRIIYNLFKKEPGFMIVSHTCDPETDSAAVLKRYADSLKADSNTWIFLTGRKDSLYNQARYSYLLDDPKNGLVDISDQFLHTSFFALVDKNGNVRGQVYDGLKDGDLTKLKEDIKALLKEKKEPVEE